MKFINEDLDLVPVTNKVYTIIVTDWGHNTDNKRCLKTVVSSNRRDKENWKHIIFTLRDS